MRGEWVGTTSRSCCSGLMSDYMRIGGIMPSRPAPRSNYPAQDALLTKPDISAAKVAVAALGRRLPAKS
jgi:hypothetical protein